MSAWKELPKHLAFALESATRYHQQLVMDAERAGQAVKSISRLIEEGESDPYEIRSTGDLAEELLGASERQLAHDASHSAGYLRAAANRRLETLASATIDQPGKGTKA